MLLSSLPSVSSSSWHCTASSSISASLCSIRYVNFPQKSAAGKCIMHLSFCAIIAVILRFSATLETFSSSSLILPSSSSLFLPVSVNITVVKISFFFPQVLSYLSFLFVCFTLSCLFAVSLNAAWKELVSCRPPSGLISAPLLMSVMTQILICLGFQIFTFLWVKQQPWYTVWTPTTESVSSSSANAPQQL